MYRPYLIYFCAFLLGGCMTAAGNRQAEHLGPVQNMAWSALNTVCVPGVLKEHETLSEIRFGAEQLTGRAGLTSFEKAAEPGLYLNRAEAWKYEGRSGSFLIATNLTGRSKCAVITRQSEVDTDDIIGSDGRYYFVSNCPVYLPRQKQQQHFQLFRRADGSGVLAASFHFDQVRGWIVARFDDVLAGDDEVRDYCQYVQRII